MSAPPDPVKRRRRSDPELDLSPGARRPVHSERREAARTRALATRQPIRTRRRAPLRAGRVPTPLPEATTGARQRSRSRPFDSRCGEESRRPVSESAQREGAERLARLSRAENRASSHPPGGRPGGRPVRGRPMKRSNDRIPRTDSDASGTRFVPGQVRACRTSPSVGRARRSPPERSKTPSLSRRCETICGTHLGRFSLWSASSLIQRPLGEALTFSP